MGCQCKGHEHSDPVNYGRCCFVLEDGQPCGCALFTGVFVDERAPTAPAKPVRARIPAKRIADFREMLEAASEGTLTMEKDASFGLGLPRDVWRIVGFEARRRMRELGTTARPNYVATVYSEEYTRLFVSAVAVLPVLLDEIEELRAPAPESAYEDKDFFHAIHPVPKCCGVNMEGKGNLSLHVLGYKCPSCNRCIHITVTFTEGWPDTDPETIAATDETP